MSKNKNIFESPTSESEWLALLAYQIKDFARRSNLHSETATTPTETYERILYYYLFSKTEALQKLIQELEFLASGTTTRNAEWTLVLKLARLRQAVRLRTVTQPLIDDTNHDLSLCTDDENERSALKAEILFVQGQAYEVIAEHAEAHTHFKAAALEFDQAGILTKSCRAQLNALSNYSCNDSTQNLLPEYFSLAEYAQRSVDPSTQAICYLNISREYQRRQSLNPALSYVEQALALLKGEKGTLHECLSEAHKADLLIELGRTNEARSIIESLEIFSFAELNETLKVLNAKIKSKPCDSINLKNILPTWKERLQALMSSPFKRSTLNATPNLEQQAIALLSDGPIDKFTLIESLYGESSSFFIVENRLKNLLNRIRNKHPGGLNFQAGKYSFNQPQTTQDQGR